MDIIELYSTKNLVRTENTFPEQQNTERIEYNTIVQIIQSGENATLQYREFRVDLIQLYST